MSYTGSARVRFCILLATVAATAFAVGTPAAQANATSGDAYANQGANACTWTIGNSAIEKTLTFDSVGGTFELTSLLNKTMTPARQYVQGSVSSEFRLTWDGSVLTGASGGWTCAAGSVTTPTVGGQTVVELDIALSRTNLTVTRHYVVYPSESLIQEWSDIANTGSGTHDLTAPSMLEQTLMQSDISSGNVELKSMMGAEAVPVGSYRVQGAPLSSTYGRTYNNYDASDRPEVAGCTAWTRIGTYTYPGMYFGGGEWHDGSPYGGWVWPATIHPGLTPTARIWTAPATGRINISSHVAKNASIGVGGNGVIVSITRNGSQLFTQSLGAADTTGFSANPTSISVASGDEIAFVIDGKGNYYNDATDWNPTVTYASGSLAGTSYVASTGFSGIQYPDAGSTVWSYKDYKSCANAGTVIGSSSRYMPWLSLWNRNSSEGIYAGWDFHGNWAFSEGNTAAGVGGTTVSIPTYDHVLAASEVVTLPKAFVGTYHVDLDDMGNRLLDWQYRYLWSDTRSPYFAAIRMLGNWVPGARGNAPDGLDPVGLAQQVFAIADRMREIGGDTYHRDYGWWLRNGDWIGPDWKQTGNYLSKSAMRQLIYMFIYDAESTSSVWSTGWFQHFPAEIGLIDLGIPAAEQWMKDLLVAKAQAWGDFQWRNDSLFIPYGSAASPINAALQLTQDQAYSRIAHYFLDQEPNSAIQNVNGGGREINWAYMETSSNTSFHDLGGIDEHALFYASYLFPVDKMSGDPGNGIPGDGSEFWSLRLCDQRYNRLLVFNPDFSGDTTSATQIACMRKLVEKYHYLLLKGVAGRWVHVYHPVATDGDANWLQRVSGDASLGIDGLRSVLIYGGTGSSAAVTVYPKGLLAGTTYDVRYQYATGSASRTGADLMANGVTLPSVAAGELIYLNLSDHPDGGTDTTTPTAPTNLAVSAATNMSYPGVELAWTAGTDNVMLSYYEVFRNGVKVDNVSKGTYYFDHSPGASLGATYAVRSVDENGNVSSSASATGGAASPLVIDDSSTRITYSASWGHFSYPEAFNGTISDTNVAGSYAQATFSGSRVTWYAKLGPNCGQAYVYIDGNLNATIDTFAPADENWQVPIYSKSWPANGVHTIKIVVAGTKYANPNGGGSTDYYVHIDGFQVSQTQPQVTEDSNPAVAYTGTWNHIAPPAYPQASNADVSVSSTAGSTASFTFTGSSVDWIGKVGANCGYADVYIDGVYATRVDTFGFRGPDAWQAPLFEKSWPSAGTHTIKVVVTGLKNESSSGTYVHIDSFQVRSLSLTDDADPAVSYSGTWTNPTTDLTYLAGAAHVASATGASASFTFNGTAVQVLGDRAGNHGLADVYITTGGSTVYWGQFDAYTPGDAVGGNQVLWQVQNLSSGSHTIQVIATGTHDAQSTGTAVTLDGFAYGTAGLPRLPNDTNDSTLSYSAGWTNPSGLGPSYDFGDSHVSATAGSTATYTFSGTGFQIVGSRAANHGYGEVTVDGTPTGMFDGYAATDTGGNQVLWQMLGLAAGTHTVVISVIGAHNATATDSYIVLDAASSVLSP